MNSIYDVAIVGNGMFGAAATRYLSAHGLQVVAIGPSEPTEWQSCMPLLRSLLENALLHKFRSTEALKVSVTR